MGFKHKMWRIELLATTMLWPIAAFAVGYGAYRIFVWSYGGADCFRFAVIQQPFQEEWMKANPGVSMLRDAPLSKVPEYLETPGHGKVGETHPHQENY